MSSSSSFSVSADEVREARERASYRGRSRRSGERGGGTFRYNYPGHVVGSTLKAQRENPEMTVRNTDPVLTRTKQRLEQLTQELLVELGWARKSKMRVEEEQGGSMQTDRGSGTDCDDEDGCEASGLETGEEREDSSSGQSPDTKNVAHAPLPHHPSPPQVVVRGSAHNIAVKPLPLTAMTLLLLLLLLMSTCDR